MTRRSYAENAYGPLLKVAGMEAVNRMYCPDPATLHCDWRVSPLAGASRAGLTPAWVAVASHDPLRDSGLVYADALEAAGVRVTRDMGRGLIHGYLRAMGQCAASRASLERMAPWLAARLG
jgi:acetyl esterase/lipase